MKILIEAALIIMVAPAAEPSKGRTTAFLATKVLASALQCVAQLRSNSWFLITKLRYISLCDHRIMKILIEAALTTMVAPAGEPSKGRTMAFLATKVLASALQCVATAKVQLLVPYYQAEIYLTVRPQNHENLDRSCIDNHGCSSR